MQRRVARALAPITVPLVCALLRFVLGYRIEGLAELRREYARARSRARTPLLVCANHLTMIDSALIAWALGSPAFYVRDFASLPWNTPDRSNFAATRPSRALAYVLKCLPIERGGSRQAVADVLDRVTKLLASGEPVLIFPEGRRSRSGRVELHSAAWGVGRVARGVPGCRVLCVYLRGDRQRQYGTLPARGDRFRASLSWLEPKSDHSGARGSRDVAHQIVARLSQMEREYFDGRQ